MRSWLLVCLVMLGCTDPAAEAAYDAGYEAGCDNAWARVARADDVACGEPLTFYPTEDPFDQGYLVGWEVCWRAAADEFCND